MKCNITVFSAVDGLQCVCTNEIVVSRTYNGSRGVKISLCLQRECCVQFIDVVMPSEEKKGCRKFKKLYSGTKERHSEATCEKQA